MDGFVVSLILLVIVAWFTVAMSAVIGVVLLYHFVNMIIKMLDI